MQEIALFNTGIKNFSRIVPRFAARFSRKKEAQNYVQKLCVGAQNNLKKYMLLFCVQTNSPCFIVIVIEVL